MQQFFIFLSFFPSFSRSAVLCNSNAVRRKTVNFVSLSGREERSREGDEKMMNWRELESCKLRCKICRIGAFGYDSFRYSLGCYSKADSASVVVEVVGWDGMTLSRSSRSSTPRRKIRSATPYIISRSPPFSDWKVGGLSWGFVGVTMKHQLNRPR